MFVIFIINKYINTPHKRNNFGLEIEDFRAPLPTAL